MWQQNKYGLLKVVVKASLQFSCFKTIFYFKDRYCPCRDPEDPQEKLEQKESQGLKYF